MRKKLLLLLSILIFCANRAEAASGFQLNFFGSEMRFERANSQDLTDRKPTNLSFAFQYDQYSLLTEYSQFEENSGNATVSIKRKHQDASIWLRRELFQAGEQDAKLGLFAGAGLGAYEEKVDTTLMGATRGDQSPLSLMSGVAAGVLLSFRIPSDLDLLISTEGRALVASEFEPNVVLSAVMRVGLQIPF